MTREEEIKARMDSHSVAYYHPLPGHSDAEPDMLYLLSRNEELQRRVEKMQAVVDAAIAVTSTPMGPFHDIEAYNAFHGLKDAVKLLDAKEKDDEATD